MNSSFVVAYQLPTNKEYSHLTLLLSQNKLLNGINVFHYLIMSLLENLWVTPLYSCQLSWILSPRDDVTIRTLKLSRLGISDPCWHQSNIPDIAKMCDEPFYRGSCTGQYQVFQRWYNITMLQHSWQFWLTWYDTHKVSSRQNRHHSFDHTCIQLICHYWSWSSGLQNGIEIFHISASLETSPSPFCCVAHRTHQGHCCLSLCQTKSTICDASYSGWVHSPVVGCLLHSVQIMLPLKVGWTLL